VWSGMHRPLFAVGESSVADSVGTGCGRLPLHTDAAAHPDRVDLVGLHTVRAAEVGGFTRIASAEHAYAQLTPSARRVLAEDYWRANPHGGPEATVRRPIFKHVTIDACPRTIISYHPLRIREGLGVNVATNVLAALNELDHALDESALDIPMEPGDLLLLDNRAVTHGRTAFKPASDPSKSRLLERLWIQLNGSDSAVMALAVPQIESRATLRDAA
jgi:alpha-ketoglutarate-dependent taurine dioxygenase